MGEGGMGCIKPAFHCLHIIAVFKCFGDMAMCRGGTHPFIIRHGRLVFFCAHIGPNDAAFFNRRIGFDLHFGLQRRARGFRGHIHAIAMAIKFPTMIDTAQAAFFIAAKEHGRAPMRAMGIDKTNLALAVFEGDQIFAQ